MDGACSIGELGEGRAGLMFVGVGKRLSTSNSREWSHNHEKPENGFMLYRRAEGPPLLSRVYLNIHLRNSPKFTTIASEVTESQHACRTI